MPGLLVQCKARGTLTSCVRRPADSAVKMYNWEEPVKEQVKEVRDKELGVLRSSAILTAANMTFMSVAPIVVAISALFAYAADDGEFTASRVFAALSLFGQLRFPLMMCVAAVCRCGQRGTSNHSWCCHCLGTHGRSATTPS